MSNPHLPPESLDYIVDFLHDKPETLKECCLVSKSWVPRTRIHIFASIELTSAKTIESWERTFPDPSNSPAHHTRTLSVRCTRDFTAVDAGAGGLIQTFSRVERLMLMMLKPYEEQTMATHSFKTENPPFALFHTFLSTLKSLHVESIYFPCPQISNFILSFPLLEDLTLTGYNPSLGSSDDPRRPQIVVPSTSPPLTGSLVINLHGGMGYTARQLLDLPNGLHFRKLAFSGDHEEDLQWIMELVAKCCDTLERLNLMSPPSRDSGPTTVDLSKTIKLRDAAFWVSSWSIEWVTMALQTITPNHQAFRQISIYVLSDLTHFNVGTDLRKAVGETVFMQWLDLDRLLVQLWESLSARPMVTCMVSMGKVQNTKYCIGCLLPGVTKGGIIDIHLI